jgi:hypothetical protein
MEVAPSSCLRAQQQGSGRRVVHRSRPKASGSVSPPRLASLGCRGVRRKGAIFVVVAHGGTSGVRSEPWGASVRRMSVSRSPKMERTWSWETSQCLRGKSGILFPVRDLAPRQAGRRIHRLYSIRTAQLKPDLDHRLFDPKPLVLGSILPAVLKPDPASLDGQRAVVYVAYVWACVGVRGARARVLVGSGYVKS